jgi:hypothetical protein
MRHLARGMIVSRIMNAVLFVFTPMLSFGQLVMIYQEGYPVKCEVGPDLELTKKKIVLKGQSFLLELKVLDRMTKSIWTAYDKNGAKFFCKTLTADTIKITPQINQLYEYLIITNVKECPTIRDQ